MSDTRFCKACALPLPVDEFLKHGKTCKRCRLKKQIETCQAKIKAIDEKRAAIQKAYRESDRKLESVK